MPNPVCKKDKQETQYNTESYSCGLSLRESKKWKYLQLNPLFCQQGFELCSPKFVNLWNSSSMSQISSLVPLLLMAILIVKMMMMNWWWLCLRSRLWLFSIFGELHFQVLSEAMQTKVPSRVGLPAPWEILPAGRRGGFHPHLTVNSKWVFIMMIRWSGNKCVSFLATRQAPSLHSC